MENDLTYILFSMFFVMIICPVMFLIWEIYRSEKKRKVWQLQWQKIQEHAVEYDFYMDGIKHNDIYFPAINIENWQVEINEDQHEVYLNRKRST